MLFFSLQKGSGDEPQLGPSDRPDTPLSNRGINYAIGQKTKRTYSKSAATETSYEVKVSLRLLCLNELHIIFCKY